ncbi:MAG TPA: helix-turn-helix transcriptional regulator [Actinophytocola sp.]
MLKDVSVVNSAGGPTHRLARRLRSLRVDGFAGHRLTQSELAEALGTSVPLISSWESRTAPKTPPKGRLEAYATFFATEKSVAQTPFRVLPKSQLTSEEQTRRDELFRELTSLRNGPEGHQPGLTAADPIGSGHWLFPPDQDITIVCSMLPPEYLRSIPYTDPNAPDYVDLYKFADLDALFELFGHVRAANPLNNVRVRTPNEVTTDDYTSHLVVLGGVDWNRTTAVLLHRLELPVRQLPRPDEGEAGGFVVGEGEDQKLFAPVLEKVGGNEALVEDVAHFFRAPSPFNEQRTITICNGMYGRGTYGAVRALTDVRFRARNEKYLRERFAGKDTFSILSRVKVFLGVAVTPDWSSSEDLLHEWSDT